MNKKTHSILSLTLNCLIVFFFVGSVLFLCYFYFPQSNSSQYPEYDQWDNGQVNHILAAADHETLLLKVSLQSPIVNVPQLKIGDLSIPGEMTDTKGRFWQFYVADLDPDTRYLLTLLSDNIALADPWPLKTYPHPDSLPESLTILAYTCAGGVAEKVLGKELFIPIQARHALLRKGLSYNPDFVIANGDHIYWDRKSFELTPLRKLVKTRLDNIYGHLDLDHPMMHELNYQPFTNIGDAQIAELYGCLLRSTPVYFISDDHDLFENDEAKPELVTLPPEPYMLDGALTTQHLYYPEYLSSYDQPDHLPATLGSINQSFGSFRYGRLAEGIFFDAKRYTTLDGPEATLIPLEIEQWINDRMADSINHFFLAPSSPVGWTAGKWLEWYPDILMNDGTTGIINKEKYLWQSGWWLQHQRLLKSFKKSQRTPFILQGDLHDLSYGLIHGSGTIDFSDNPIHVIGTGPLGTGQIGFPSSFRGTTAQIPEEMDVEEILQPLEKNGFTILEISRDAVKISMYAWRPEEGIDKIETLDPILVKTIKRK